MSKSSDSEDEENEADLLSLPWWTPMALQKIDYPAVMMVGKRRTGKSFFLRWIMEYLKDDYPQGLIFTETRFNGFWQKHFPESFIHENYRPKLLKSLMERQAKLKDMEMAGKIKMKDFQIFIIFDDVMGITESVMRHDGTLTLLLTAGRHFGITCFFLLQDSYGMPPKVRNNVDVAIIFKQQQKRNLDAIHENWLSTFLTKKESYKLIGEKTKDHHVIVVDTSGVIDEDNTVYHCKAKEPKNPNFRLGNEAFWNIFANFNHSSGMITQQEKSFSKFNATGSESTMFDGQTDVREEGHVQYVN